MDVWGLVLSFVGTVILAFSTSKYFKWINLCISVHEIFIDSYVSGKHVGVVAGTDQHLESTFDSCKTWMLLGVLMVVGGFALQLLALILE